MTFADTPQADQAVPTPEQRRTGQKGSPWLTTELAVLRQHYSVGGSPAVQALLPYRTLASIRSKAASEGVPGQRRTTLGKRFARRYPQRADLDTAIIEGYVHAKAKGDCKRLAERLGRPAWWVQRRAAALGLTRTNRTRLDCWKAAELQIVEDYAVARLPVIVAKLKKAGFHRTPTAVAIVLKRRQIDRTNPDVLSATQLGPLLGVNPSTVVDWIDRRGLKGRKSGDGRTARYELHCKDVKRWIAANHCYVDPRRVDWHWFCGLMFGGATA